MSAGEEPARAPLAAWAEAFARERIEPTLERRWRHDTAVLELARSVSPILPEAERETLIAAAALHDIGFAPVALQTGFQPLDGALFLESFGVPKRIRALVANSVSARIEAELRGLAGAYEDLPDEATPLRDALWYSCITTDAEGRRIDVDARVDLWPQQYPEPLVIEFAARARGPLREAVARTEKRLRDAANNR